MQKCAKWSGKIGETKKSDTAFEESCERIMQQASTLACSFRFVIILETRAKACYAARPTSKTISRIITGNKVNGGGNDPPRNTSERRVIQLAKSVDTQERQPAADDNCQR